MEKLRDGFEVFRSVHGRLPTAHEIDALPYLPSSRFIQKKFGGLEDARKSLGYINTHFGKGSYRTDIALRVNKRGRTAELSLQEILQKKFGKPFVHIETMFGLLKNRLDFYVFCPNGNFGIDVFHTDSWRSLQSNVNIKMNKYGEFSEDLYLVSAGSTCTQEQLDAFSLSKSKPLPANIKLLTLESLYHLLEQKGSYPDPTTIQKS